MDFVEEVLRYLTARMQIEAEWAVQEQTSFTWWAHTLAQRVWVAPPRDVMGVEVRTVHVETDLLADVPMTTSTWARLASINRFATLSAYVANKQDGTVRLHASVSLTRDNWLLARAIALHAMALQMADAFAEAAELANAFGGWVNATPHPGRGLRETPDEMVGVIEHPEVFPARRGQFARLGLPAPVAALGAAIERACHRHHRTVHRIPRAFAQALLVAPLPAQQDRRLEPGIEEAAGSGLRHVDLGAGEKLRRVGAEGVARDRARHGPGRCAAGGIENFRKDIHQIAHEGGPFGPAFRCVQDLVHARPHVGYRRPA